MSTHGPRLLHVPLVTLCGSYSLPIRTPGRVGLGPADGLVVASSPLLLHAVTFGGPGN